MKHKFVIEEPGTENTGTVTFDDEKKSFAIDFPDDNIVRQVTDYLSRKREYRIPKSQRIDDTERILAFPTQDLEMFTLALSGIYGKCDVWCISFP